MQVDRSAPTHRWHTSAGLCGLPELSEAWDRLARASEQPPTADSLWTRCYWEAFACPGDSLTLHALLEGDKLLAVLPLVRTGRLVRAWVAGVNAHNPCWAAAIEDTRPTLALEVLDHLLASADMIDLAPLVRDSFLHQQLVSAARARGLLVAQEDVGTNSVIDLFGPWSAFCRSIPHRIDRRVPRKLRHLRHMGELCFEHRDREQGLDDVLGECFALEARGLGGRGHPILSRPETLGFYTQLAHAAAPSCRLAVDTLRLDSRLIAFEYSLRSGKRMDVLKVGYDHQLACDSPGNALRYLVLQREVEKGEVSTYHLGITLDWKLRWATRFEPLSRLRIYTRRPASLVAYGTGPRLRGSLKRSRLLRRGLSWLRRLEGRWRGGGA